MHSASSTAEIGSFALTFKKRRGLAIVLVCVLILLCFSRLFVGVHTPFDVAMGIVVGVIGLLITEACLNLVEKQPSRITLVCTIGIVLAIAAMIFTATKDYPLDYVNGTLLVDPAKMVADTFSGIGAFLGAIIGWYIEEKFVQFKPVGASKRNILLVILGMAIIGAIFGIVSLVVKPLLGATVNSFIRFFLMMLFAIGIWPAVLKRYEKH